MKAKPNSNKDKIALKYTLVTIEYVIDNLSIVCDDCKKLLVDNIEMLQYEANEIRQHLKRLE